VTGVLYSSTVATHGFEHVPAGSRPLLVEGRALIEQDFLEQTPFVPVSGSVFGARAASIVSSSRERERARPTVRVLRATPTNSLSPTPSLAASREPPEFPDKL